MRIKQRINEAATGLHQLTQLFAKLPHDLDIVFHVTQWRVDLMRHTGHHLAQRGHFFRLHQLCLRRLQLPIGL